MFRRIPTIGRTYRQIARYGEMMSVLIKYGLGDLLSTFRPALHLPFKSGASSRAPSSVNTLSRGDRIRMAFVELGPTFIKLGQFMSNRPDVVPPEIIVALRQLQDNVAPFPAEESVKVLEKEFGKPVSGIFADFAKEPFASASMGQVHHATLANGVEVAVKVMRPNIEEIIETDIDILFQIASIMENHLEFAKYVSPLRIHEEFSNSIRKELNFLNEASYMERFAQNFRGNPLICVPDVYKHLSTKRILTTKFVDGIKVSDVDKIRQAGLDPAVIAERGTSLLFTQVFEHGFFHADPHPGNILVLSNGVICFLDFGIMGILSPSLKEYLVSIMFGVITNDPRKIVRTIVEESGHGIADVDMLEYDVTELLEDYISLSLKDVNIGEIVSRLAKLIVKHRIRVMPGFYLLIKAMISIEGVGLGLDPNFALVEHARPFAKRLMAQQLNPFSHVSGLAVAGMDIGSILRDIPYDLHDIMRLVKAGRTRIEFEHRGLEPMLRTHDVLVDRLAVAVILSSLVIGSSLVVLSKFLPDSMIFRLSAW